MIKEVKKKIRNIFDWIRGRMQINTDFKEILLEKIIKTV
jgi:hypothetical protein